MASNGEPSTCRKLSRDLHSIPVHSSYTRTQITIGMPHTFSRNVTACHVRSLYILFTKEQGTTTAMRVSRNTIGVSWCPHDQAPNPIPSLDKCGEPSMSVHLLGFAQHTVTFEGSCCAVLTKRTGMLFINRRATSLRLRSIPVHLNEYAAQI